MKNYKIIFKDKKTEYLSYQEYAQIEQQGIKNPEGSFWIGKNRYLFEDIWRMEEPKSAYPAFDPNRYVSTRDPERRKNAIKNMGIGLKKCIPSKTGKPEKLVELMRLRYQN